jgi:hypothetical protein
LVQYLPGGPDRPPPTAAKRPLSVAARKSSTARGVKAGEEKSYTDIEKAKINFKTFLEELQKTKKWARILKEIEHKKSKVEAQEIIDISRSELEKLQAGFRIMYNVMLLQVKLKGNHAPLTNDSSKLINLFRENSH